MSIVLSGSTGITDADGGTVLNTNDLASQAQAETGTDNATLMTPLRTAQAITAQIKPALNASGSAPIYACRAWVNFNGTGTIAIRASGNVTSITDNAVGDFTVNFTTAMQDANYSAVLSCANNATNSSVVLVDATNVPTTSALRMTARNANTAATIDPTFVNVAIFR